MGKTQHTVAMDRNLENYDFGLKDANVKILKKKNTDNVIKGRLQKKTVLCGNNSHVGRPPPTPPVWEFFRRNTVFFSEDVPKQNFFIIVKYVF